MIDEMNKLQTEPQAPTQVPGNECAAARQGHPSDERIKIKETFRLLLRNTKEIAEKNDLKHLRPIITKGVETGAYGTDRFGNSNY